MLYPYCYEYIEKAKENSEKAIKAAEDSEATEKTDDKTLKEAAK